MWDFINTFKWITTLNNENIEGIDFNLPAEGIKVLFESFNGDFFTGHVCFSGEGEFICTLPDDKETSCEINPSKVKQWSYIEDKHNKIIKY